MLALCAVACALPSHDGDLQRNFLPPGPAATTTGGLGDWVPRRWPRAARLFARPNLPVGALDDFNTGMCIAQKLRAPAGWPRVGG